MKKILKITGLIIGIIILVIFVVVILFPALPTYLKVKKNCPHINDIVEVYTDNDISVSKDFETYELKGLYISAPKGTYNKDSEMIPFKDGKNFMVMVSQSELSDYNFYDVTNKFSKQDYEHFYNKLNGSIPQNTVEDIKFLRNMTLKDCLKLRGTDIKIFEELAESKEYVTDVENVSIYENNGVSGLLCDVKYNEEKEYLNLMFNHGNYEYIVTVIGENSEAVRQVITSVIPTD
ncbi:MAG: hypothetical protein K2O29_03890 [Ruminococcus sp.]|nr:hypothetical protein [Ruminococcus sp.]